MPEPHPLVSQLRFTRAEFRRGLQRVSERDACRRLGQMNSLSWNVGHLAWQEQRYFLELGTGELLYPEWQERFAFGAPASTPTLRETLSVWTAVTQAADPWLDTLSSDRLLGHPVVRGRQLNRTFGNLLQRTIYHYWYHNGENQAIRQQLGHQRLPQFVGNIDDEAPYRPAP